MEIRPRKYNRFQMNLNGNDSFSYYYEYTFKYLEIRQQFFILSLKLSQLDECILQYDMNG